LTENLCLVHFANERWRQQATGTWKSEDAIGHFRFANMLHREEGP
jgi:hypothetical protein